MKWGMGLLSALVFTAPAWAEPLQYDVSCLLPLVAERLGVSLNPEKEVPAIWLASQTSLDRFQEVVAPTWGIRPNVYLNAYLPKENLILLNDNRGFYNTGRGPEDSLVHELTHYIQVVYMRASEEEADHLESQAIEVQTWFRETYMWTGRSPCAAKSNSLMASILK